MSYDAAVSDREDYARAPKEDVMSYARVVWPRMPHDILELCAEQSSEA